MKKSVTAIYNEMLLNRDKANTACIQIFWWLQTHPIISLSCHCKSYHFPLFRKILATLYDDADGELVDEEFVNVCITLADKNQDGVLQIEGWSLFTR